MLSPFEIVSAFLAISFQTYRHIMAKVGALDCRLKPNLPDFSQRLQMIFTILANHLKM